jgi:hypothetical protein
MIADGTRAEIAECKNRLEARRKMKEADKKRT